MNHQFFVILLFVGLIISTNPNRTCAQASLPLSSIKQDLAQATACVAANKLDSAKLISEKILDKLRSLGQVDEPFGLKVQLVYGAALEHNNNDTIALQLLLHVQEESEVKKQWETYAETCRVLARLYEKIQRSDQSIANLRLAQAVIAKYRLDSIYPRFAIRISSWHRGAGNQDSSMYYANEVLRTAPNFGQIFEEAEGHLIIGLLWWSRSSYEKSLQHHVDAAQLYRKIGDYSDLCSIYNNIAYLHLQKGKLQLALAYTDSTLLIAEKAIEAGKDRTKLNKLPRAYKLRGEIYHELGRPDSAWYYLQKGQELEIAYITTLNNEKVVEVDARYKDEKKAKQIEEQAKQIKIERERWYWFLGLSLIALLFAAFLTYFFLRLRKVNQKNKEQSERLGILDIAKSRFFANVSHELRTPLTLMLGPIHTLLKENQLPPKQIKLLRMANRSGKQLQQLVNEILDLRKLEMGKMGLNNQPTELATFFRRYLAQFESLAERNEIDFSFKILIDSKLVANIDQEKCRQILYNLLSNAFKFTPNGGWIETKLSIDDNMLQLSIADSGAGIHPDDLPHVFNRFFQTNRPEKPIEGGTGIGLALCYEYTKLFGGNITVESTQGKGTTFQVAFPITMVESPPSVVGSEQWELDNLEIVPVRRRKPRETVDEAKPTILVVEDNSELQEYLRLILSEHYNVLTAKNGQAAWNCLLSTVERQLVTNCQLILSDLMMPVMDGYQLLEKLKSNDATRHIPVILLTARADVRDKLKALRIGVDDYLLKPFDEKELLVRIENLLKNQAARRAEVTTEVDSTTPLLSEEDRVWLEGFENYVQGNLSSDILSVPILANEFAMSESTLLRQLKRLTGLTPLQYIQEMRLDRARQLLEDRTYNSIAKVAYEVGYADARSFSRTFKNRFGKLPSEFLND